MADSRHLGKIEKSLYLGRGLTDFDEIWYADAIWPSWLWSLKFEISKKSKMATSAILRNPKSRYLDNGLTDRHEIWHDDAIRHLWCVPQKNDHWVTWHCASSNAGSKQLVYMYPSTSSRILYCGHSTQYSHLVLHRDLYAKEILMTLDAMYTTPSNVLW